MKRIRKYSMAERFGYRHESDVEQFARWTTKRINRVTASVSSLSSTSHDLSTAVTAIVDLQRRMITLLENRL